MSISTHDVLVTAVEEYEARSEPPCEQTLARSVGTTVRRIQPALQRLCRMEFLAATGSGYRPTVTAREFLALDVAVDDVSVVDLIDE